MAADKTWKVGELARLTGVSVRTLHHYHEIGLLCPSERSESGYRLYSASNIARLQQIKSLRHLGFSLEDVRVCLERTVLSAEHIIELHLARVKEQIALQQQLRARLETVCAQMNARQAVSVEEFLTIIEVTTMIENYYTPEQIAYLQQRGEQVGAERIREVEAEWPRLIEQVRAAMERGDDPASEPVQALARRWKELVNEFTGGDPGIHASLTQMYQNEENIGGMNSVERQTMFDYIQRANEAATK
jgi:DNA-binding transcriptional MerR regulator